MDHSFEALYEQYLPKIYRYMYNRTFHKPTSEDLTSSVFMKALTKIDSFKRDEKAVAPWLYTIARNTLIDHYRKNQESLDLEAARDLASSQNIEGQTDSILKLESVIKAMQDLSEDQREVLILRVWDGLTHQEIGTVLNISEDNSKVILSRSLSILKLTLNLE